MELRDIVVLIASVFGAGGIIGGIIALLKLRPEAGQITVSTAQGVLLMQTSVIADLRGENERMQNRMEEQSARCQERIDALEAENSSLVRRLDDIEFKLAKVLGEGG